MATALPPQQMVLKHYRFWKKEKSVVLQDHLLRRVRADARFKQLPVVMLTAHAAGPVSQKAIDMGAQAFLTKPYSPNELLAQVRRYTAITQPMAV